MVKQVSRSNKIVWQDVRPVKKVALSEPKKKPTKKKLNLKDFISRVRNYLLNFRLIKKANKVYVTIPRKRLVFALILVIAITALFGIYNLSTQNKPITNIQSSNGRSVPKLKQGNPTFTPILPSGKTLNELEARVNDGGQPLLFFSDKISGLTITISQQPLPASFKNNVDGKIEIIAKNSGANDKINVDGTQVYIARPLEGLENAIFTKNNLLIYIKTSSQLTNEQWSDYIKQLN